MGTIRHTISFCQEPTSRCRAKISNNGIGDLWMWLQLMWLQVALVRGPVGVVWGRCGTDFGPQSPKPVPNRTQTTPTRPRTTPNCSRMSCRHIHTSATLERAHPRGCRPDRKSLAIVDLIVGSVWGRCSADFRPRCSSCNAVGTKTQPGKPLLRPCRAARRLRSD